MNSTTNRPMEEAASQKQSESNNEEKEEMISSERKEELKDKIIKNVTRHAVARKINETFDEI